jgi:glyoxylase-like metal-dependent hydrolase (beta-lactamase superfamily II)
MRLNDDLVVLPLAVGRNGQTAVFNLSLITDAAHGPTLVDTGVSGQASAIAALLAELGVELPDLRRIILTHQDHDHIGSLAELARLSGAEILAGADEADAIDGTVLPRFALPETLAQRPELREIADQYRPTPVDGRLADGQRLDLAGGVRVIFTPGHTPGHVALFLERSRTLLAGDALRADNGQLLGPNPAFTPDPVGAAASVRKLSALDVAAIVCYHGGVVDQDANGQLLRVAEELSAAP